MSADLESRYRRLLRWYPWEHRRAYEEEMLDTLLAGARPGQRRPGPVDTVDLLLSAARHRVGLTARGLATAEWRDAAAATGVLGALLLVGLRLATAGRGYHLGGPAPEQWLRLLPWVLVAVAAVTGLRWVAAGVAWLAVAGETALLVTRYSDAPTSAVFTLWAFTLAVVTAVALTVPAPPRHGVAVLGVRRVALVTAGVLVAQLGSVAAAMIGGDGYQDGGVVVMGRFFQPIENASYLAGGLLIVLASWRLAPPLRLRIIVLLAPVAATLATAEYGFDGWRDSYVRIGYVPLAAAQWAILALIPILAFALGVVLIRRHEQRTRLLALGRTADRVTQVS